MRWRTTLIGKCAPLRRGVSVQPSPMLPVRAVLENQADVDRLDLALLVIWLLILVALVDIPVVEMG